MGPDTYWVNFHVGEFVSASTIFSYPVRGEEKQSSPTIDESKVQDIADWRDELDRVE